MPYNRQLLATRRNPLSVATLRCHERGDIFRECDVCGWARGRLAIATCVILVLVAGMPSVAQAADEPIFWQSRNDTYTALTKEFADLYRDLLTIQAKGGSVPTTTVTVPEGKTIAAVLRERRLFDGKDLPRQLDIFVCQLNPRICKVTLGKTRDIRNDDATASWTIQPNDDIITPDIRFEQVIVHKPYQKNAGGTLKSIVVDERQGCDTFDEACQKYVQNLNRRVDKAIDSSFSGKIIVPTKAYRAVIPLESPSSKNDLIRDVPGMVQRAIPSATATLHNGASDGEPEGLRSLILKLIKHPLATDVSMTLPRSTNVAIFDSWVDKAHCMLKEVTVLDPDGRVADMQRAACGVRGDANDADDHGTHVVGLISMRIDGADGPGVDPYASVTALSLNTDKFKCPTYLATQSDRLRELYRNDPPDVVNMSFEYNLSTEEGRNDVFHAAMKEQERGTLFVASAGNDAAALDSTGDCRVRPACYDDANIVTVGAIDLSEDDPKLLTYMGRGSNYGDRVHIVAPGQNIVSTISGNRLGVMSGTSQAAPQVAGSASLLYHYASRALPSQVKNRLIYTSDLFPTLYEKVRGGRLNVRRLLAYKSGLVDLADGRHLEGRVSDPVGTTLRFLDFNNNEVVPLSFGQIRRLKFHPDLGYHTLFYNEESERDSGVMKRRRVTLKDMDAKAVFAVPTAAGPEKREKVNVREILDYVSPLLL